MDLHNERGDSGTTAGVSFGSRKGEPWRWDKSPRQRERRRIYGIVERKRQNEGPLEPAEMETRERVEAKGWHTRGYLPHADLPGTLQMVTFRLADSVPAGRRAEWEQLLKIEHQRERRTQLEAFLDRGYGECWLRQPGVAEIVERTLLHADGDRYRLAAWVIMPNHVHVVVELWRMSLSLLLKVWKGTSSHRVNRLLGRQGQVWQEDYFDRLIRDEAHFRKARDYVERNPVMAGLVANRSEWRFNSANPKWLWTGPNRYHLSQLVRCQTIQQGTILYTSLGEAVEWTKDHSG